jgi:hypothetical protein
MTDPIFAAIAAHKAAETQLEADIELYDDGADFGLEVRALLAFLTTKPTTVAGITAALEYAGSPLRETTVINDAIECSVEGVTQAAFRFPRHLAEALREMEASQPRCPLAACCGRMARHHWNELQPRLRPGFLFVRLFAFQG